MALTNAFYQAVETKNILRIRIMMKDSLLVDLTFKEFSEMEKVASCVENLYDKYDEKPFIVDKALWNDDYMNKLMVKVLRNFSHERISHLKDVVRYLRPIENNDYSNDYDGKCNINDYPRNDEDKKNNSRQRNSSTSKNNKFVIAGAVTGGVVATVIGASFIGITGGVVAGAIVGGVSAKTFGNK